MTVCTAGVTRVTVDDLATALRMHGGDAAKSVANNPKLLQATFDILKGIASSSKLEVASGVASAVSSGADIVGVSKTQGFIISSTSFVVNNFQLSMALSTIGSLTPGRAVAVVSATGVQKVGLMLGLAGDKQESLKCAGALTVLGASVVTNVAGGAVTGGVMAVLTIAGLSAAALDAYQSCR